jgi:hypothetical protein
MLSLRLAVVVCVSSRRLSLSVMVLVPVVLPLVSSCVVPSVRSALCSLVLLMCTLHIVSLSGCPSPLSLFWIFHVVVARRFMFKPLFGFAISSASACCGVISVLLCRWVMCLVCASCRLSVQLHQLTSRREARLVRRRHRASHRRIPPPLPSPTPVYPPPRDSTEVSVQGSYPSCCSAPLSWSAFLV